MRVVGRMGGRHSPDWMDLFSAIPVVWTWVVGVATILGAIAAFTHAVLYKRDPRAAVIWVGFILLAPLLGPICYFLFGINRIRRRASSMLGSYRPLHEHPELPKGIAGGLTTKQLENLSRIVSEVTGLPLIPFNKFEPLETGDVAFPAMLKAISEAQLSVTLATYIFNRDSIGLKFVEALREAVGRGVEVRVLVDAAGARYSLPSIMRALRKAGIPSARFLPALFPFRNLTINLRNHRKVLVIDGKTGFTGGMNIREGNCTLPGRGLRIRDTHFKVTGPIVSNLQAVFTDDWRFATGEVLRGHPWFTDSTEVGTVLARSIVEGPDADIGKLKWAFLAGISAADEHIRIMTPYFLPDQDVIAGLNLAAMRGVKVDIVLPANNNLKIVHWATMAILWQVLKYGCRVWLVPGVFDHSKIMVVDRQWSMIGSANWDPRSLRLNFEYNIECYDSALADQLAGLVDRSIRSAHALSIDEVDRRPIPVKLRDGVARLFTPLL